jgi:hypothetical protein
MNFRMFENLAGNRDREIVPSDLETFFSLYTLTSPEFPERIVSTTADQKGKPARDPAPRLPLAFRRGPWLIRQWLVVY